MNKTLKRGEMLVYYKTNFQNSTDLILEMLSKGKTTLKDALRCLCENGNAPIINATFTYCSDATKVPVTEIRFDKIGKRMICVFPEGRW